MRRGSKIFELYGYPVDSWCDKARSNLSKCNCPFMDDVCDGGGNRYSTGIKLTAGHPLKKFFPNLDLIQAGVCSLQLHKGEQPWIVCPRRLLNYRNNSSLQHAIKEELHSKSELKRGDTYAVWSEVKLKCPVSSGDKEGLFDYTFDYVIAGRERKPLKEVCGIFGKSSKETQKILFENGFTTCAKDGTLYCDDFPTFPLVIVEVMTSSTSGGNKKNRTQISQLFEDTVYQLDGQDVEPAGPGINYRQVWARMVSQLLVKSQIGRAWGGDTFWVLQDQLVDYISKTTALNLSDFLAEAKDEVNIISGGYGKNVDPGQRKGSFADIDEIRLYSGAVSASSSGEKSFSDIIKLNGAPDISELWKKMVNKRPCATFKF